MVRGSDVARLDEIGRNENTSESGPAYLFVDGGSIILDGYEIRNVIFRNTRIIYHGGPLRVDDAYFVNCSFDFDHNSAAEQFASAAIEHSVTTVEIG